MRPGLEICDTCCVHCGDKIPPLVGRLSTASMTHRRLIDIDNYDYGLSSWITSYCFIALYIVALISSFTYFYLISAWPMFNKIDEKGFNDDNVLIPVHNVDSLLI